MIKFNHLLLTTALGMSVSLGIRAQDCTGNRYYNQIFSTVTETKAVEYGRNYKQDGTTEQILQLDIYEPSGDTDTDRPLIVFAHGGSFISGTRGDVASKCRNFAKMGYVAASITYRLLELDGTVLANPGLEFQKEVVRAIHDMRSAIRFFRKGVAEDGNPYGINPNIIIVGGVSAGAILANHVTYMDDTSKVPMDVKTYVAAQGGLEGNSGNAGYSSVPQMTLSLCGAIGDTLWIEQGDQPYVGVHNITDNTVPNVAGYPNVGVQVPVMLYGDSSMFVRTQNVDVNGKYMSVPTTGHCQFPASADTFVTNFMHLQLCVQGLAVAENPNTVLFSVYPNPSNGMFNIDVPSNEWKWEVSVVNMLGQTISRTVMQKDQNIASVDATYLPTGIYTVKIVSDNGKEASKKILVTQ